MRAYLIAVKDSYQTLKARLASSPPGGSDPPTGRQKKALAEDFCKDRAETGPYRVNWIMVWTTTHAEERRMRKSPTSSLFGI